jgi:Methyltransferase domain
VVWTVVSRFVERIDTINPHEFTWDSTSAVGYNFRILVGDGCKLNIPDESYDIAHSNSVIEHVGSWERQKQFASEIRRVGKSFWVQTPAREFFIEPHYLGFGVRRSMESW